MKITDAQFQEVLDTLFGYYGARFTIQQIREVVEKDDDLIQEILEDTWTDTCIRERLLDDLSQSVIGMSYPMYGDTPEYAQEFSNKATELNVFEW